MSEREEFVRRRYRLAEEKVKIVFYGQPGAGKSSVINAICGEQIARSSGMTDTTTEPQFVEHGQVLFVDLPGYGTELFPKERFLKEFNPLGYDLYVCVFDGKLHAADTELFRLVTEAGKPCIFVRNKSDLIYEEGKTTEECREEIRADLCTQLGREDVCLLFVSSRSDRPRGIKKLNEAIESMMGEAQQEKYRMAAKSYTAEELARKKEICGRYVARWSRLAAANGLNVIPGVNVAADLAILFMLYKNIREGFGLTEDVLKKSSVPVGLKNVILKGMTKEGIIFLLTSAGKRLAANTMLRYVPLVGQAAAAIVGYKIVKNAGESYLAACYQAAEEMLYEELGIMRNS